MKHIKKSKKSEGQKLFKSQKLKIEKLAKLGKNLSKIRKSSNFDAKEKNPSFLTSKTKVAFNRLWLAFTKALVL